MNTNRPIDFIDLKAQQNLIRNSLDRRISQVLNHGTYIMGPEVQELERSLETFTGAKNCVTCSSGTDALLMSLMAFDVGPGDAIFTTPFTFFATAEVISLLGATPVFVDIDPHTFNLDPLKLSTKISETIRNGNGLKPRGIIPVDLFGQPADYLEIEAIAKENGLFVVQDAAQSFGATYQGQRAGNQGDLSATSFFPAKPLGCYGDGGAIFCSDVALAEKLRSIRVHGKGSDKYDNVRIGVNGRLDTIQAAILLAKLEVFEDEIVKRNEIAGRYSKAFEGKMGVPRVVGDRTSVWAQYSLLSSERDLIMARLKKYGIPSVIYYPVPLHLQSVYKSLGHKIGDFPVSEEVANHIFSLPMHPYLRNDDQERIIDAVLSSL